MILLTLSQLWPSAMPFFLVLARSLSVGGFADLFPNIKRTLASNRWHSSYDSRSLQKWSTDRISARISAVTGTGPPSDYCDNVDYAERPRLESGNRKRLNGGPATDRGAPLATPCCSHRPTHSDQDCSP